jgi:hypothetical protein
MTVDTIQQTGAGTRVAIQAGGLIGAIGAAASISGNVFMSDLSQREGARSPLSFTANALIAVGFLITAMALAGSSDDLRMPRWAVLVGAAGCAMVSAVAWGMATFGVETARLVTDTQWDHPGAMLVVAFVPKMILCALGFGAFAVVGWRKRTFSRGACILLGLAAVVSGLIPPHQPGGLVGGLALVWAARSAYASEPQHDAEGARRSRSGCHPLAGA